MQANPPRTSAEKRSQHPRLQRSKRLQEQSPQPWLDEPDSQENPTTGPPASLTCRLTGCHERACGAHGFCAGCRVAYEYRARLRERHLAVLAAAIEREHRALVDQLAPHGAPRALLLAHAAAHQHHHGNPASGITSAAVRDFLDDAMERVTAEHLANDRPTCKSNTTNHQLRCH